MSGYTASRTLRRWPDDADPLDMSPLLLRSAPEHGVSASPSFCARVSRIIRARLTAVHYFPARRMGPADSPPRDIHGEVIIVAAELDPTPLPRECSYTEPRWRVGFAAACCPVLAAAVPLRK